MNILKQFSIIFIYCLLGELVVSFLPFAFPSSVVSLLLFFLSFVVGILKPAQVETVSNYLLQVMAIFFIPAGVGIIEKYDLLKNDLVPILIITLVTSILTFVTSAYTVLFFIRYQKKREEQKNARTSK